MKRRLLAIFAIATAFTFALVKIIPVLLKKMGYHPDYERSNYHFKGQKALIITTSHDVIDQTGKKTGVYGSELTVPYYEFVDAGLEVDLASIQGGKIPIEPFSQKYPLASQADRRFLKDVQAQEKSRNSFKVNDLDFGGYDLIFMSGGWGAAYDLGFSETLGTKITAANAKNVLIGAVCHGVLGFRLARETTGRPLVEGKNMTGVSNRQIKELGIESTPLHPETELRSQKANYIRTTAFMDTFATGMVTDGNIVTGQNQNSGGAVAQELMRLLEEKNRAKDKVLNL